MTTGIAARNPYGPDSRYAWWRLAASLAISTLGGVGLWSAVVVLPTIEAEFHVSRGGASLPFTATMRGFAVGGIAMGRLADRFGIMLPLVLGAITLGIGFVVAAGAATYWQFLLAQALLIGLLGSSTTFGPLVPMSPTGFSGSAGSRSRSSPAETIWLEPSGRRFCNMRIEAWAGAKPMWASDPVRRDHARFPGCCGEGEIDAGSSPIASGSVRYGMPLAPANFQAVLVIAAVACCVAMSMPQVHHRLLRRSRLRAARGAEMLSLILGLGVVSRLASGLIADRIGGVAPSSWARPFRCLALIFYLPFDGWSPLLVSALFGLSQGGIVPGYALIVREYFPAREAGARVSLVLMSSVVGMALGGWMSGEIFDLTGSYQAAFLNGIGWNLLNMAIAYWLLIGRLRARASVAR
jgi:MFS family permease